MFKQMQDIVDEVTDRMKQSKCDELIRDIKGLTNNNKQAMFLYVELKDIIKQFRHDLNDKGLQSVFMFIAEHS